MVLDQNNSILARLHKLSYCLLFAFPALPNALQSIVFAVFLIFSLVYTYQNNLALLFEKKKIATLFFLTAYYIFFLLTYLYPSQYSFSIEYIQPTLLLLIGPIVLFFSNTNKLYKNNNVAIFIFTISSFWSFYLLYDYWVAGIALAYKFYKGEAVFADYGSIPTWDYIWKNSAGLLNSLSEWGYNKAGIKVEINTHHTFLASVYNLNVILILSNLNKKTEIYQRIIAMFAILVLAFFIYFLESKVNIMCLALIVVSSLSVYIFTSYRKFGTLLCLGIILVGSYVMYENRSEFMSWYQSKEVIEPQRKRVYKILLDEVKHKPIFGFGGNNVKPLVDSLLSKDSTNFHYSFNVLTYLKSPHSQFIFNLMSGGAIQLSLFLCLFGCLSYLFISNKNIFGLFYVFLVAVNCVFEDFLNRAWGVYLFALGLIYFWNNIVRREE